MISSRVIGKDTRNIVSAVGVWLVAFVLFAVAAVVVSFRVRKPDVVVSTSPQFFCGLAGAVIARIKVAIPSTVVRR